jgi:hypothetical protein
MCCGNASGNHKLKFAVIGEAKKPWLLKGTKTNCIPDHYYNQKRAQINREFWKLLLHAFRSTSLNFPEREDYHRKHCCCQTMSLLIQDAA